MAHPPNFEWLSGSSGSHGNPISIADDGSTFTVIHAATVKRPNEVVIQLVNITASSINVTVRFYNTATTSGVDLIVAVGAYGVTTLGPLTTLRGIAATYTGTEGSVYAIGTVRKLGHDKDFVRV